MERAQVSVEVVTYQRLITWEGRTVLRIRQRYPRLTEQGTGTERINRYYRALAGQWRLRWEEELAPLACEALAQQEGRPPWEAVLDFTVTYNENGLFSLYLDAYEFTGGAHGHTVRRGDTWELPEGMPRSLFSFFPKEKSVKRCMLTEMTAQAQEMRASGEHLFLDDHEALMRKYFEPSQFYLTPDGVVIFYPLYAIAPYVEGFPTFIVPRTL